MTYIDMCYTISMPSMTDESDFKFQEELEALVKKYREEGEEYHIEPELVRVHR